MVSMLCLSQFDSSSFLSKLHDNKLGQVTVLVALCFEQTEGGLP